MSSFLSPESIFTVLTETLRSHPISCTFLTLFLTSSLLPPLRRVLPFFSTTRGHPSGTPVTRLEILEDASVGSEENEQEPIERVVILGASSGCGAELAEEYIREVVRSRTATGEKKIENGTRKRKGVKLLLFARRIDQLEAVRERCLAIASSSSASGTNSNAIEILVQAGDISDVSSMVHLRSLVIDSWGGFDTLHILSGLPSTQTLLEGCGLDEGEDKATVEETSETGLQEMVNEAKRVNDVNCIGVLLSVATFMPLLQTTSASPLIHHLSSVAALIPAPTRCLYAATKAGGLAGFRTAAWEQVGTDRSGAAKTTAKKEIRFVAICPGTIDTDFRRKSSSASKGMPPPEGFDRQTLTVHDTVDCIMHHCSLTSAPAPWTIRLPCLGLNLGIPFIRLAPSEVVWLPEFPYRYGSWLLDTPLAFIVRRSGRKKYGLK